MEKAKKKEISEELIKRTEKIYEKRNYGSDGIRIHKERNDGSTAGVCDESTFV